MKKHFKILSLMMVFVLGSVITTQATTEWPTGPGTGTNPFEPHRGISKTEVHEPISGVCLGLSEITSGPHNTNHCFPLNAN